MQHRIRLTDEEMDVVIVALRQYRSGKASARRRVVADRLEYRFLERTPGNPALSATGKHSWPKYEPPKLQDTF